MAVYRTCTSEPEPMLALPMVLEALINGCKGAQFAALGTLTSYAPGLAIGWSE